MISGLIEAEMIENGHRRSMTSAITGFCTLAVRAQRR